MKHNIGQFQVVGGSNASGGLRRIGQSHHELSADACPFLKCPTSFGATIHPPWPAVWGLTGSLSWAGGWKFSLMVVL
jgi:hypothetical protein